LICSGSRLKNLRSSLNKKVHGLVRCIEIIAEIHIWLYKFTQMKVFRIKEDVSRKKAGYIDAVHKWGLPGVDCPSCNSIWSTVGLEYPTIDLTDFADEEIYRQPRLVKLEVFLDLRKKIADAFPKLPLLNPGAEFGSSVGKAVGGKLNGFVWRAWWTICFEASTLEKLKNSGLSLPRSVKAEVTFKKEEQEVLEFDLPLKGKLINGVYDGIQLNYCDVCGRNSASLPEEIQIGGSSVPDDTDIFRVSNFPTLILITEHFREKIANLGIKGAVFEEVKIV
jgi:uncharacterized double-CXXCG motif protein